MGNVTYEPGTLVLIRFSSTSRFAGMPAVIRSVSRLSRDPHQVVYNVHVLRRGVDLPFFHDEVRFVASPQTGVV